MDKYRARQLTVAGLAAFWLVVLLACCSAKADTTVGLHVASHHWPDRDYQNNSNPGLYVRTPDGWTFGGYRNTLRRTSVYAGYTWESGPFALGAGLITGYQRRDGVGAWRTPVAPFIVPSVALPRMFGVTPRLSIIPGTPKNESVLHFSIETNL